MISPVEPVASSRDVFAITMSELAFTLRLPTPLKESLQRESPTIEMCSNG
jgi:hypothetical protein